MANPVTSVAALRARVYEILVGGSGVARTLSATERFARGSPPAKVLASARTRDAQTRKRVFVLMGDAQVVDGNTSEMTNRHMYRQTVVLSRDYWLGYEGDPTAVDAALDVIADDFMRVRAALCQPGNVAATTAAASTGVAHDSLESRGATSRINFESSADGRLINARDTFTCLLIFDPDA